MRVASLNLNGIRAANRKGLAAWMSALQADILAFQEVRALPEQVPAELLENGHWQFFPAERKGYSGVALWSKLPADEVCLGMGVDRWDAEGRVLEARWGTTRVVSAYFPSGASSAERQVAKLDFLTILPPFRKNAGGWISPLPFWAISTYAMGPWTSTIPHECGAFRASTQRSRPGWTNGPPPVGWTVFAR